MSWIDFLGFLAAFSVLASFCMTTIGCRRELGWNFFVASLRWADDIYSGGQINRLSNELAGEGLPAVDLAHADLP